MYGLVCYVFLFEMGGDGVLINDPAVMERCERGALYRLWASTPGCRL